MTGVRDYAISFSRALFGGCGFLIGATLGFAVLQQIEPVMLPVTTDWEPLSVTVEGDDLVVSGVMVKRRNCDYIQPPRARSATGNKQFVVISRAPTSGLSWAADADPQPFGPWVIKGAVGHRIEMYIAYRCHPLWVTNTILGEIGP